MLALTLTPQEPVSPTGSCLLKNVFMKQKVLDRSVNEYVQSLEKVLEKRKMWKEFSLPSLLDTLHGICDSHDIGWTVQELNWLWNNKAVNLSIEGIPRSLAEKWDARSDFEFVRGAALVFSQQYNGDVAVFVIYPEVAEPEAENETKDLGRYHPGELTGEFITEKVCDFLEALNLWEGNVLQQRVGF